MVRVSVGWTVGRLVVRTNGRTVQQSDVRTDVRHVSTGRRQSGQLRRVSVGRAGRGIGRRTVGPTDEQQTGGRSVGRKEEQDGLADGRMYGRTAHKRTAGWTVGRTVRECVAFGRTEVGRTCGRTDSRRTDGGCDSWTVGRRCAVGRSVRRADARACVRDVLALPVAV